MQKFTSANTSINKNKLPAIYGKKITIEFIKNKKVIDIGGGKYDNAKTQMSQYYNADVSVYDKYNRDFYHNKAVLNQDYDVAIISNVLNVIDSESSRLDVVILSLKKAKTVLITVYEGDKSGKGRQTGADSYQLNQKTDFYISEIKSNLKNIDISKKNGVIILKSSI